MSMSKIGPIEAYRSLDHAEAMAALVHGIWKIQVMLNVCLKIMKDFSGCYRINTHIFFTSA